MTVKTTGAEFKRFYADTNFWSDQTYHEDALIYVNGEEQTDGVNESILADDDVVTIEGGYVIESPFGRDVSLKAYFKKWLKTQSIRSFLVECDVAILDAVKAAIRAAGGKVS